MPIRTRNWRGSQRDRTLRRYQQPPGAGSKARAYAFENGFLDGPGGVELFVWGGCQAVKMWPLIGVRDVVKQPVRAGFHDFDVHANLAQRARGYSAGARMCERNPEVGGLGLLRFAGPVHVQHQTPTLVDVNGHIAGIHAEPRAELPAQNQAAKGKKTPAGLVLERGPPVMLFMRQNLLPCAVFEIAERTRTQLNTERDIPGKWEKQ